MVNREQRVGVFVDVQNMYYSAKNLYGSKVNFKEILRKAVSGRKLVRAIAYAVRAQMKDEETFYKALENIGFEVKLKELQIYASGLKKADWDVGLAMDALEMAPKLDVVILVSGDGDFIPLVHHLQKALGCKVEVIAFGKSCNSKLIDEADSFTDLDDRKYLISITRR